MEFPKSNKKLGEVFAKAAVPDVFEFEGEYFVDMLTGLPSLRRFSHRKAFYAKEGGALGHNILFKNRIWGRFFLEKGTYRGWRL